MSLIEVRPSMTSILITPNEILTEISPKLPRHEILTLKSHKTWPWHKIFTLISDRKQNIDNMTKTWNIDSYISTTEQNIDSYISLDLTTTQNIDSEISPKTNLNITSRGWFRYPMTKDKVYYNGISVQDNIILPRYLLDRG